MKASAIRQLAAAHDVAALDAAADGLAEGQPAPFDVPGADDGERLTHLMLASRLRARIDAGHDPTAAFRELMAEVRSVVRND